jgi:hypothetical protein
LEKNKQKMRNFPHTKLQRQTLNTKKTDGSHHPEVPSQIDKREFATLIFWALPNVALKLNPHKALGI